MRNRLFRAESLEKLSSPERLDALLRVTTPGYWLGLVAMLLLVGTAAVWGYVGTVTTTVDGRAVLVRDGGVLNVVSQGSGVVLKLNTRVGARVRPNEVVATVTQPTLLEKLRITTDAVNEAVVERDRRRLMRERAAKLQMDALDWQRGNTEREIQELTAQAALAASQVTAQRSLLALGLVTQLQVIQAQEKQFTIETRIAGLRAQLRQYEAQVFAIRAEPEEGTREDRLRLSQLQGNLAQVDKERALTENVLSPFGGEVTELKVSEGAMVTVGQPILSLQADGGALELVGYIPSAKAKDTKVGMEVQVSPSTVKREEFGFIRGTVSHVSEYPATPASVMRNFANESLVKAFVDAEPVTEVWVTLARDPRDPRRLQWAGRQPDVVITSGTICSIRIETRHQRPMELAFPAIRETLGLP